MTLAYDLKIGYRCNNNCIHCVIRESRAKLLAQNAATELTFNQCIQLLDAQGESLAHVTLTGGEPTIHSDFLPLLSECIRRKLSITIQTNGRNIGRKEIMDVVKTYSCITFVVAVHGASVITHDTITQRVGSFYETLQGVDAVIQNGGNVVIKTVISQLNLQELSQLLELFKVRKISGITVAFPHAQGWTCIQMESVLPRYCALREILPLFIKNAKRYNINVKLETIPFCVIPEYPQLVGELEYRLNEYHCTQVGEETYDWNKLRIKIKGKVAVCCDCLFNPICEGVWSEYLDYRLPDDFIPITADIKWKSLINEIAVHKKLANCDA